jgi:acetyl-CoA C-acetyltransferase
LSSVRADDFGAVPIAALMARNTGVDRAAVTDVLYGCVNQAGVFDAEICPVTIPQSGSRTKASTGDAVVVSKDEHPRETSLEALAKLGGVVRPDGAVTAGNASGVNDGACALLLASEAAAAKKGLTPRARVVGIGHGRRGPAHRGLRPGTGHAQGAGADRPDAGADGCDRAQRGLRRAGLAVLRDLGLADDDARVDPHGGAIARRLSTLGPWDPFAIGDSGRSGDINRPRCSGRRLHVLSGH